MKSFTKVICAAVLAFSSFAAVTKPVYVTHPPVVTSVVPADASGYWYSQQVPGLKVVLAAGSYYANGFGLSTCGKVVKATVSIPRVAPSNGWVHAEGQYHDSSNTGVAYGQTFNLLTKSALAGTFSVTNYDAISNYLTVQINTPAGGPSGTYQLSRDPLTPHTALIVPNCQ